MGQLSDDLVIRVIVVQRYRWIVRCVEVLAEFLGSADPPVSAAKNENAAGRCGIAAGDYGRASGNHGLASLRRLILPVCLVTRSWIGLSIVHLPHRFCCRSALRVCPHLMSCGDPECYAGIP